VTDRELTDLLARRVHPVLAERIRGWPW